MHRNRHTKIVATLGPASSSEEMIQWLFERGVDVFRLNFSHGTHETHAQNIRWIRKIETTVERPISILADLQGPKLRVGQFKDGHTAIKAGQIFIFDRSSELGNEERVQLPHPEIFAATQKGDELLVDDGKLAFRVDYVDLDCIKTTALISGTISNNKGVNLPSTHLPIDILTSKDINDLNFVLSENVDYIALSFVQSADDIIQARKRIQNQVKIIAKLEKPQAIQNLSAILKETDGVMIARGDLGVELPPELVPPLQRRILREAQIYKKPVIVATQMLESMISAPKPTRAEASDVATAVYLGTDAVMLSAESASGQYPKEAVEIMDRIIFHAEQDLFLLQKEHTVTNAHTLPEAAALLACQNKAKAIVALSNSLEALISISSLKPETPILAVTSDLKIYHQLPLLYGIHAVYSSELPNTEHPIEYKRFAQKIAVQEGFITRNNHQIILLMSNTLEDVNFSGILLIS